MDFLIKQVYFYSLGKFYRERFTKSLRFGKSEKNN
jgi:hypothetical protein